MAKAATAKKGTTKMNAPATDTAVSPAAVPAAVVAAVVAEIKEKAKRSAPAVVAAIRSDIPLPAKSPRGVKSSYNFDALPVMGSIGVLGKTADKMASTVSAANRRYREPVKDANGAVIFKLTEVKDNNGNVVGKVPSDEPASFIQTREFQVFATDPVTDPDNATCRIFRTK